MATFHYQGRSLKGLLVQGQIEAPNTALAADQLVLQGITPVAIRASAKSAVEPVQLNKYLDQLRGSWRPFNAILFTRQIHTLVKSGVPLMRALEALEQSADEANTIKIVQALRKSLDAGRELSQALINYPRQFPSFYVAMVRVGELSGRLEEVFMRLTLHLEFEVFIKDQVKAAVRYPMFVVIVMSIAFSIVTLFVIPAFSRIFAGANAQLPLVTRWIVDFSDLIRMGWPYVTAAAVFIIFGGRMWAKSSTGKQRWDHWKLHLPVAGKMMTKAMLARFSRSFALALKSGVPMVQSMSVVAETVDNAFIATKIHQMREHVARGESLLRAATVTGVFTPIVLQMLAVGEESGAIDEMMDEVASMYQRELEYELKTLSQQIEPILILLLGGLVLILALGVFLPMWDLARVSQIRP